MLAWKSKRFYDESIKPPAVSNNSLISALNYISTKVRTEFFFKKVKVTFTHKHLMNICFIYYLNLFLFTAGKRFTLGNYLFVAAKLNTNADPDNYKYYDIILIYIT